MQSWDLAMATKYTRKATVFPGREELGRKEGKMEGWTDIKRYGKKIKRQMERKNMDER